LAGADVVASVINPCDQKLHPKKLHDANHDAVTSRLTRTRAQYIHARVHTHTTI
jgi:hypothetical protein